MKKQMKWLNQLKTLKEPTQVCKICFKEIKPNNFFNILHKSSLICSDCQNKLKPKFKEFFINETKALAIYEYDEEIKTLLYQFKGCFDIELAGVFLQRYYKYLKIRFQSFTLVPAPSYYEDDEKREFNHVVEIFSKIGLPMEKLIYKSGKFKQAEHNSSNRKQISDYLCLLKNEDLSKTKILLVDDVHTTGSTLKACIELLQTLHPKEIQVLVMSKTKDLILA